MPDAAPTVYLNGDCLLYADAATSIEDRGTLYADGVYEVLRYTAGRAFAMHHHTRRLTRSLGGIELTGVKPESLVAASDDLVRRNRLTDAKVYWQVTRGPATRSHIIAPPSTDAAPTPTVLMIAYPADPPPPHDDPPTITAITVADTRWTECWIKSLMLLPNTLARTRAARAGAGEAIFCRAKPGVDDVHVTEGSTTNLIIVRGGELYTHPDDGWVLPGITRHHVVRLARGLGLAVHESPFTPDTMLQADEVLITGTSSAVTAVTAIDGHPIGTASPDSAGPMTRRLAQAYRQAVASPL